MKNTIDSGVPIPPKRRGPPAKYAFRNMQVGDSFWVAAGTPAEQVAVRTATFAASKRLKTAFTTRREKKGIRVWRTA